MRISGSNLLWLVCSLPFLFFAFSAFFIPGGWGFAAFNMWIMAILAPFTFFPATSALFSVTRKWVMGEADVGIIKTYFKGYKENYKQSMFGGIFYTLLTVIMIVDYQMYMKEFNNNLQFIGIVILVFLVVLLVSLFHFFSMVAHYYLKVTQLIKNAILLTILKPFRMLSTVICTGVLVFLTIRFPWLIFFGLASLTALVAFFNFYAAYNKVQEKVEKLRAAEEAANTDENGDESTLELPSGSEKEKD